MLCTNVSRISKLYCNICYTKKAFRKSERF
ncbi:zinc-finger domain-containing protein [Flavobacterium tibetense]